MKILLISDAHSNLHALETVLDKVSFDDILFVGDAVDYGPNPFEVYSRLHEAGAKMILGNHDAAAAFGIDCRSSEKMHEASVVTRRRITIPRMPEKGLSELGTAARRLRIDYEGLTVEAMHASPRDELYEYISREQASNLEMGGTDLMVLGHTHIQYEVRDSKRWIVNPGSVGMPKDGDPRASYAILDTYKRKVEFGRKDYDIENMLKELSKLIGSEKRIFELLSTVFRTGFQ
jgi:putative phosphoesterase